MNDIADIRKDYKMLSLSEKDVAADPIEQFTKWWDEAVASNIDEVNAMTLATATKAGKPSARIVLLKAVSHAGFEFFTNYESDKATDMAENNQVSLVFFWKELERQIRIEGIVSKIDEASSDKYFSTRPQLSKIGAWASPQSKIIASRAFLEEQVAQTKYRFENKEIPRPVFWGGYLVKPNNIEFWQGRSSRLHDRIVYSLDSAQWRIKRLAP